MVCGEVIKCDICRKRAIREKDPFSGEEIWFDFKEHKLDSYKEVRMPVVMQDPKTSFGMLSDAQKISICVDCYRRILQEYPLYADAITGFIGFCPTSRRSKE